MSGPLIELKVLELAGVGPSPYACMLLADLGADVLRLERGAFDAEAVDTWDLLNRSRSSVAVDLKNDAGRELVLELCERADVLIEGFRPGVMERLRLGPREVCQRNARLVYARMTGYGQDGPLAQRAGHDINYVAISGALWPLGRSGDRPTPALNLVGDFAGGSLFLVMGVLAAVIEAKRSGEGQIVDAAMVDGSASLMAMTHSLMNAGYWVEERGVNLLDTGAHFYEVYETKDERYVAVGAIEAKFYDELLSGLGLRRGEVPDQMDRTTWCEMKEKFARLFKEKTRDEWTEIFHERDACVTPVLSPSEAAVHPYNTARGVFSLEGMVQPQPAPRFSRTPARVSQPPQRAGSGSREGLRRWGVNEERLDHLRAAGAFG